MTPTSSATDSPAAPPGGGAPHSVAVFEELDWERFAAEHWDRGPVLFKNVTPPPFVADEVFDGALAACRPMAGRPMPDGVELGVGAHHPPEPGGRLPTAADGSLTGYEERMARELGGERYSLVIHGFHAFDHAQWRRERDFYTGLWHHTGQPLTGAITTLFHGTYSHSPVGVHKDRFATFMYALHGRKRMRFWTHRPWHHPVSTILDYQPYLPTSFTATAEPGDLLYWPATHYHVGESDLTHHPATSLNIGIPREHGYAELAVPDLLAAGGRLPAPSAGCAGRDDPAAGSRGASRTPPAGEHDPAALPPQLARALADVRDRTDDRLGTPRAATVLSLEYATAGALRPVPDPGAPAELADPDLLTPRDPVRWAPDPEGSAFCAANGHVAATTLSHGELLRLVEALAPGAEPGTVGALLARTAPAERAEARRLLGRLVAFRALAHCAAAPRTGDLR